MKIRSIVALLGLAMSFALPTVAQQKETVDPKIEQQIRVLAANYDAAINRHDATAVAALYTQDGVHVFNGTSHGRQAIEKSYAQSFQIWQSNNHFTKIDRLISVGNEVRATGRCNDNPQDAHGVRRNNDGYYSWIIVREGDTWKIRRSTLSETNWPSLLPSCSSRDPATKQISQKNTARRSRSHNGCCIGVDASTIRPGSVPAFHGHRIENGSVNVVNFCAPDGAPGLSPG